MTINELKLQKRWVCWRLETVNDKETKVPYQPNGRKAMSNNPATWSTHAECLAVSSRFSGVGVTLGDGVVGVDLDKCCDAVTGKFTPASREIVIALDSYGEYSPSGTGAHVFCLADFPEEYRGCHTGKKGDAIVKPGADFKQIEIKGSGFYFTLTGRHLQKTPTDLMPRQEQINALCDRIAATKPVPSKQGIMVSSSDNEEKYKRLMSGDLSDFNDDKSRADLALCNILARKHNNNFFKIDEAWLASPLYRDKLDRTDYRSATIMKAIKAEPIFDAEDDVIEDDGVDEYLVNALTKDHEGWFPKGDISLIGGSSGTGKTYWTMAVLEKVRLGVDVWGHKSKPRDYRVLMMDRGAKAMRRTLQKMKLPPEAVERIIRVTSKQQAMGPVAVMDEVTQLHPGAEAWFIEGLDLWLKESDKMGGVAPALDELQRIATRRNVAIIASVGTPKQKTQEGKDTERYRGRDTLFGSVAWGRKSETIVLISKTDDDPLHDDCPRQYSVLVRNGRSEHFWMGFNGDGLCIVDRPGPVVTIPPKTDMLKRNVFARFKPGERIKYTADLGASDKTYYKWAAKMALDGLIEQRDGGYWISSPQP
ncbi:MAG TPA: hypothetical protein VKR59_10980 [Terriglobales bacterium]|nr:hypothetical protein [Terriglobales bacterium]